MTATQLWLIRHGVTEWNHERRFQGHRDIGLHPQGHRQAQRLARRLADSGLDAVYTSDLARARDTALPLADRLGLEPVMDPALRERCYGGFEACTREEILSRFPLAFERWHARDPDFELPGGGETLRAFRARCAESFERIARRHPGARVAVVCHGGVLDIAYRMATGMELDQPRTQQLLNASINRVSFEDGCWALIDWGDVAHLDDALDDVETHRSDPPVI